VASGLQETMCANSIRCPASLVSLGKEKDFRQQTQ
jgi:hypothetical protein